MNCDDVVEDDNDVDIKDGDNEDQLHVRVGEDGVH